MTASLPAGAAARSGARVAELLERHLPGRGPVTEATSSWLDPTIEDSFLNEISRATSRYRDAIMVQMLARHVREGHRVFAVVGGSHVVMQERLLRSEVER